MPSSDHDLAHLVALIAAAQDEAARLGARAEAVRARLETAAAQARALEQPRGQADEGVRVDDLTTANDR